MRRAREARPLRARASLMRCGDSPGQRAPETIFLNRMNVKLIEISSPLASSRQTGFDDSIEVGVPPEPGCTKLVPAFSSEIFL